MNSIDNSAALDYTSKGKNILTAVVTFLLRTIGYDTAPAITFSGGGGSGAAATATVVNGRITAITITNAGSSYETAPTVEIAGSGGATAVATVSGGGVVNGITITNHGTKNTLLITDNTDYGDDDSRKIVDVEVFDKVKGKAIGNVPATPEEGDDVNTVSIDVAALDISQGLDIIVRAVSVEGKVKDGTAYNIGNAFTSGSVTMEK